MLCKVNGGIEFENHIFVRICNENYTHLTLQPMLISDEKPNKIGAFAIILEMEAKNNLYV